MSLRRRLVAAVERMQPVSQELAGILGKVAIPPSSGMLVIANGTTIGARALSSIIGSRSLSVMLVADTTSRAEETKSIIGTGEILSAGTPLCFNPSRPVQFCAILTGPGQVREVFEELLFEQLPDALADGAIVAVQFCRDAFEAAPSRLQLNSALALEKAQDFLRSQFATTKFDDDSAIASRFANDPHYEYLGWCPRAGTDAATDSYVWLVLRKRPGAINRPAAPAQTIEQPINGFARTPCASQFLLTDFEAIVSGMKQANIQLINVERYANRLRTFGARAKGHKFRNPFGLLKFDIHGNVLRPLEMARILSHHSATGLFMMMPRHPLNAHFYDQPSTWRILREIETLGHEIGLHIDPFHLVAVYEDLYSGLDAALEEFRSKGIAVRSATLHGDSRSHIKERKLQANDFFHDGVRKSKWDGKIPKGEMQLASHIRAYSLVKIAKDFGIGYFPEVNFLEDGKRLTRRPIAYLSDNQHAFAIRTNLDEKHFASKPYRLNAEFLSEALASLSTQPFLALFHPQWYW